MSDARYKIASAFAALLVLLSVVALPVAPVTAIPSGLVTVPDSNVSEDFAVGSNPPIRAADLQGSVMVSSHAETTEVIVTTPERAGEYMQSGTVVGSGEVAIVIRDDVNEGGRAAALDSEAVKGALGYAPDRVYGTHDDGSSWSSATEYEAGLMSFDVPHFSANTVTFSGEVTLSGNPASDGTSYSYNVSDVDSVSDFSINVTGNTSSERDTETFSPSTSTTSVQTFDPAIAGSSVENVDVTYTRSSSEGKIIDYFVDTEESTTITKTLDHDADQIRIEATGPVGAYYELSIDGTQVKSGNVDDGSVIYGGDVSAGSTIEIYLSNNNTDWGVTVKVYPRYIPVGDVTVSAGGVSKTATGGSGSTTTLSPSSFGKFDTIDIDRLSGSGESSSLEVSYTEIVETSDPTVEVNGDQTAYSGTLSNGETASLSTDSSWIREGENTVTVSVGSDSGGDAPVPNVDLEYSHNALDNQSVDYASQKWVESYNVSKTFGDDRSSTSVTIPFDGNVYEIASVEKRVNGGSWQSISSSSYSLENTKLTVETGSVSAGDTVAVRTTGEKVLSVNGSITVTEPTTSGNRLDSRIRFDSWASDSYLSLGGTPDEQRIHYLYNETWDETDSYSEITAEGYNRLHVPNAAGGSEARVSTVPVRVNAKSGEVELEIRNPTQTEPEFVVRPGSTSGDEVEYTYLSAESGTSWILWSHTEEIVRDSGEANSPVTLVDDDSGEILQFQLDDDGSSSAGGSEDPFTGVVAGGAKATPGNALFIAFAAAILAAVWFLSREFGSGGGIISLRTLFIAEAGLVGLLAIETLSPASFVAGIAQALVSFAGEAGAGVATAMPLALLVIGGVVVYWLRSRSRPSKIVNFRLGGGRD